MVIHYFQALLNPLQPPYFTTLPGGTPPEGIESRNVLWKNPCYRSGKGKVLPLNVAPELFVV